MNMLAPIMIQVSPQIKLKPFELAGRAYTPQRIHLTGMRIMIEASDETGQTLWKDFPTSHGLYAPCTYDPATRGIDSLPSMDWWAEPLRRLFDEPRVASTKIQIHHRRDAKSWIILNTLDTIFGHSLHILLNAQFYLEQFPQHGLIVIATPELLRYVPADVHEIWDVQTTPRDVERFHTAIDTLFRRRCAEAEVYIASAPSHPDPSRYNLRCFNIIPTSGPVNTTAPKIIFIYRGTRLWGGSWTSEQTRLARLATWLKKLWPECRLEIFGHAPLPVPIIGWKDQTRRSEPDYDKCLLEALANADLVLGAHGSSQLLPSAISRLVLELTPLDKQPSLLQDFLFDAPAHNVRQHIWRRRFLYGNAHLSDISPRQVAQLINAMISMHAQFDFYQSTIASDPLRHPAEIEQAFAGKISPEIDAWRERMDRTLDLPLTARIWNCLRRIGAERD